MIYPSPILWNPINFIDGEGRWLVIEFFIIIAALFSSKILSIVVTKISKKSSSDTLIAIAQSLHRPLFYFIWYLAALYSFDLVTEKMLTFSYPNVWRTLLGLGIVGGAAWFLIRLKNNILAHATKMRKEKATLYTLSKIGTLSIVLFILIVLNDVTELKFTTLLTFGGIGGIALALAAQDIISNFFGGLMVHITRPFVIGDAIFVPAHNISGTVEEIGWYQTRIRDEKTAALYVPNALFSKTLVTNRTRETHSFFNEKLSIEAKPDQIEKVLTALSEYLSLLPDISQKQVHIEAVHGSQYTIALTALFKQSEFTSLRDEILLHIATLVSKHGGKLS